jgi:hypothetical protein
MADFLTGLLGCGFGLGLAFFGIGIVSAADFGHGVLRWGYGGLVVLGKVCNWVWERKGELKNTILANGAHTRQSLQVGEYDEYVASMAGGWILGTGCYSVEDCVEWDKGSIYYME